MGIMTRLTYRYTAYEFERLVEAIFPEEDRSKFTDHPWAGEGFRHYRDPKIACLEHYQPWPSRPYRDVESYNQKRSGSSFTDKRR